MGVCVCCYCFCRVCCEENVTRKMLENPLSLRGRATPQLMMHHGITTYCFGESIRIVFHNALASSCCREARKSSIKVWVTWKKNLVALVATTTLLFDYSGPVVLRPDFSPLLFCVLVLFFAGNDRSFHQYVPLKDVCLLWVLILLLTSTKSVVSVFLDTKSNVLRKENFFSWIGRERTVIVLV